MKPSSLASIFTKAKTIKTHLALQKDYSTAGILPTGEFEKLPNAIRAQSKAYTEDEIFGKGPGWAHNDVAKVQKQVQQLLEPNKITSTSAVNSMKTGLWEISFRSSIAATKPKGWKTDIVSMTCKLGAKLCLTTPATMLVHFRNDDSIRHGQVTSAWNAARKSIWIDVPRSHAYRCRDSKRNRLESH
jgi:hypothetical protein